MLYRFSTFIFYISLSGVGSLGVGGGGRGEDVNN